MRLALLAILCAVTSAAAPNVLFVLLDDLGYGDLRAYGNPYVDTPHIDSLVRSGVLLTHHYAPSPLCAPARAGFLTGRYNHRTGAVDVSSNRGIDRIAPSEKTFGDYFRHAGYTTALIGKWHNGLYNADVLPHRRGFDLFFGFPNGAQDYRRWNLMRNGVYDEPDGRYLPDVFSDETIRLIRDRQGPPFAIFLAHNAIHDPFQAPQELVEKYERRVRFRYGRTVATIYAMIEALDAGLGRIFAALKREGVWDETIIVVTSDNGAILNRRTDLDASTYRFHAGLSGNKGEVLEQGIRVPAVASWPGNFPAGLVVDTPIHGCDWLPTLFHATAVDSPPGAKPLDGRNVMPLLRGEEMPELSNRILPFQKNRYTPVRHSDAAIRKGRWKLYWPGLRPTMAKDGPRDNPSYRRGITQEHWEMPLDPDIPDFPNAAGEPPRLFDLIQDPGETTDLSDRYPEVVRDLNRRYDDWFDDVITEWRQANRLIREADRRYWRDRESPDPRVLFKDFWMWDQVDASPEEDDPLEVFSGFWSRERTRKPR